MRYRQNFDHSACILQTIIVAMWTTEEVPKEWNTGLIVKIPKSGDLRECDNWRGITLTNTVTKIIAHIMKERINPIIDKILRTQQAGGLAQIT